MVGAILAMASYQTITTENGRLRKYQGEMITPAGVGFFLLEGTWALVSAGGLVLKAMGREPAVGH